MSRAAVYDGHPSAAQSAMIPSRSSRVTRRYCILPVLFNCPGIGMPNAGRQARLEAEAERKLEAVACTPWFGGVHLGSQYCPTAFTFLLLRPAVIVRPTAASIAVHRVASAASLRS